MAFLKEEKFAPAPGSMPPPGYSGGNNPPMFSSETVQRQPMTVNGVVIRTAILLLISTLFGVGGWLLLGPQPGLFLPAAIIGAGGAIATAIWAGKNPLNAKIPAMLYAAVQGFLIGAISSYYASLYSDIIIQALGLTASIVIVTLVMYATGLIKVTNKFRTVVIAMTFGIMLYYILALGLALFGVQAPLIYDTGWIGIGFSLFVLTIASLNLFLDYNIVTEAIQRNSDERFEWYAAFGIAATVLWIYVELLRLLSKVRN